VLKDPQDKEKLTLRLVKVPSLFM